MWLSYYFSLMWKQHDSYKLTAPCISEQSNFNKSLFPLDSRPPSSATITSATTTGRTCRLHSSSAPRRSPRATWWMTWSSQTPYCTSPGRNLTTAWVTRTRKDNELCADVYRKQLVRLVNCLCVLFQVVIKYVPYVGDSKRAMDEYTSEIMMGGTNTIALHNTCEVSGH